MAKKVYGKCALCGKEGELSFEHIPPKAAFNEQPAKPISGVEFLQDGNRYPWDATGLQYQNLQQGMGMYSLCEACNSLTGSLYGNEYKEFAQRAIHVAFSDVDPTKNEVVFKSVHPLRVIKQIASMFCSTTRIKQMDELKAFVLDKEKRGIDKSKFEFRMYFTRDNVIKWTGFNVLCVSGETNLIHLSEITAFPLGFILYLNPSEVHQKAGIDITSFSDFGYDDICDVHSPILIHTVNSWVPGDYRSREEIIATFEKNREWEREHSEI